MADNYCEFSEVVENLTLEEIEWWKNDAGKVGGYSDEDTLPCDFELDEKQKFVWFHSENGDIESIACVIQDFLSKFRVNDYFALQ